MNHDRKKLGCSLRFCLGSHSYFPLRRWPFMARPNSISMGHMAICYLLAAIPMTFTAWSFGAMGGRIPTGRIPSYTFVANGINPYLGFMTGWGILMDYILFPVMNFVILAVYVQELFGLSSSISYWVIITVAIILVCIMNLMGIKSIATVNNIITILGFVVVIYFVIAACGVLKDGAGTGFSSVAFYNPETFDLQLILSGTAIACFFFSGI